MVLVNIMGEIEQGRSKMKGMGYGSLQDKEILQLLRQTPAEGFRKLFDVYHMPLCIYVVQLTDSFELAEDVVQDFFIDFWEKKYFSKINTNLRSYLYTSIHNAALAVLKKKNLVCLEEITGIPVEIVQETVLERQELEQRERELMEKLEKLPKQELAAIKAVILENKKCMEAALELEVSVNTLKTHLSRALRKLRKEYHLSILFYTI